MKYIYLIIYFSFYFSLQADNFNVGYANKVMNKFSKKDIIIATEVWLKELLEGSGHKVTFTFFDNPEVLAKKLESKKIDMAIANGLDFIKYFNITNLSTGFIGGFIDDNNSKLVTVVSKNSEFKSWKSLTDKRISIMKDAPLSVLYIKYSLLKATGNDSIIILNQKSSNRALLKLFFNKVDAAVITQHAFNIAKELNPQIGEKLAIIDNSNIKTRDFGYFRKDFNKELKKELISITSNINKDIRGKQMLTLYKAEEIKPCYIKDLEPINILYKNYKNLKRK